jgi:AraC family transcriptional regulator, arabinose operon regulatory protein
LNIKSVDNLKIKEGFTGQRMIILSPNIRKLIGLNPLLNGFYLTSMGYYPYAVYHDRLRKNGSQEYILLYCIKGSGSIFINGENIQLKANSFFIIPRQTVHHYKSTVNDPWSIYWVHFNGTHADYLYQVYASKKTKLTFIPFDENRIQTFNEILTLLENSFEESVLEIAHIKLLNFLASFIYLRALNPVALEDDLIQQSINFMKENVTQIYEVSDFAKLKNLSTTHYARLFKNKMGVSTLQYFNQLKIQKSCQYLYFSDKSIKEICHELGFSDPFYFSRLFKKFIGLSPSAYKKLNKK